MKILKITGQPVFELELDGETLRLLATLALHHYDGVCRQAGHVGGFLYGWHNCYEATGDPAPVVTATFRELDIIRKLMELPMNFFSKEERDQLAALFLSIGRATALADKQDWSLTL